MSRPAGVLSVSGTGVTHLSARPPALLGLGRLTAACSPARGCTDPADTGGPALAPGVQRAQCGRAQATAVRAQGVCGAGAGRSRRGRSRAAGDPCGRVGVLGAGRRELGRARLRAFFGTWVPEGGGVRWAPRNAIPAGAFHPVVLATLSWAVGRAGQGDLRQTPFERPSALYSPSRHVSRDAGSQRAPACPQAGPERVHSLGGPACSQAGVQLHSACHREPDRAWRGGQSPRWAGRRPGPRPADTVVWANRAPR